MFEVTTTDGNVLTYNTMVEMIDCIVLSVGTDYIVSAEFIYDDYAYAIRVR